MAGQQLNADAFRVARIRFLWDLQRPKFLNAAKVTGPLLEISDGKSGRKLSHQLAANYAADIDVVVSYHEPFWPHEKQSLQDNSRLGPLRNDAGIWLTATSYRRFQVFSPFPEKLVLRLPKPGEDNVRFMCGGPQADDTGDMYWFVNTITSRQALDAWPKDGQPTDQHYR